MNEKDLKALFLSALKSGHIGNNNILPSTEAADLRVVQEANLRCFDLVVAAISKVSKGVAATQEELLARPGMVTHFSRIHGSTPDRICFFPIELKSDNDVIDERLPNQIVDAILTFGHSIVVLDKQHSRKLRSARFDKVLPASIICYTGRDDYFEVVSVFDRFVSCGIFDFERINFARMLDVASGSTSSKVHRKFASLQGILQKIVFSQLHFKNPGLTLEEQQFVLELARVDLPSRRRTIKSIYREGGNTKLTDFV